MKVVILCGGQGTRLREETEFKPKAMVEIGHMPILMHIMKCYAHYGYKEFVLCLGYKGEQIKDYFYRYEMLTTDFTIDLHNKDVTFHPRNAMQYEGWKITLADTGLNAMTGARLRRVEKYVSGDLFMLTYGDGVTNLNINELLDFHKCHGKIGTVTGVVPPSRYGELLIEQDRVVSFMEKPDAVGSAISGGYFVFSREFFNYLDDGDGCVLEKLPLERLAKEGQLKVFHHKGFWQCMDTFRDYNYLKDMWERGNPPWKLWPD
ncbi:glucose-1-phosphate cytidylyltransferase [Candidatus Magnetominusculus xianensis]|uniref:Glucose-1-phosphate cytidylyltransferase n=1 Tax=Candidatus Magnetominusculus xianensis TaxID=1748249 RepID=A0ABR5SCT3_9BACT|nr:glucose-1-phosphate cytidylyltransferase [Candidatus Magnetominusculus xianensis]KWT82462.1 glucose-1-phosphate cytidylyltransferase [Candidatus Magnetominusculus xianensis]MBF0403182.1 glucose-1-phosphate cytidylyltransferase [Nitrospirota bacterium]